MKTLVSTSIASAHNSQLTTHNSQLTGLVKDKTEAVIPAAAVTLTNIDTGAVPQRPAGNNLTIDEAFTRVEILAVKIAAVAVFIIFVMVEAIREIEYLIRLLGQP